MAALGFRPEDFEADNVCEVWPDCWPAVQFFDRISMGCWTFRGEKVEGLRYEALREIRLALKVRAADWPALFADLQVMEDEAVKAMRAVQ